MINLNGVTKVFNKGKPSECTALNDITLSIEAGCVTVIKGPSGSGKTTLLAITGAMTKPTSGRVEIMGREISSLPERFLAGIRRTTFGFIFQQFSLIKGITALENIMIPAYPLGEKHSSVKQRALALLDLCNLSHKARAKVEWLSGGEAQRIAIARALVNNPHVIIADEPTAHLDTGLSREFIETMAQLNEKGKTVIVASHDPLIYDSPIVHRVIEFRDGRIAASGACA